MLDHTERPARAQLRYLKPQLHDDRKCTFIGDRTPTCSALWFGAEATTLAQIASLKRVLLVEGPSDLLACRLAMEQAFPVLALMGSTLTSKQRADLCLLGVHKVYLLLDGDEVGRSAARSLKEHLPFRVQILACRGKDPSECLGTCEAANHFRRALTTSLK